MYEVLRVPNSPEQFMQAYQIMKAYCGSQLKMNFHDFYERCKSIYMLGTKCGYIGVAYICHKHWDSYESPVPAMKDKDIYTLDIITFSDDNLYMKVYDLIRTIIKDSKDRVILVENVSIKDTQLINALKNNKFKPLKLGQYTTSYYYIPNLYDQAAQEHLFRKIDPRNNNEVIDKMVDLSFNSCGYIDGISEAQERYTKELLEKNSKIDYSNIDDGCDCGCGQQTEEQFLDTGSCPCCNQ